MSGKLTKAQLAALASIAGHDGYTTPWAVGTSTAEALRARGLISTTTGEPTKFGGRWGYDPYLHLTDAGRAALSEEKKL